ncbi:hypothetical protein [Flavobacterium sp. UMI-01]|uniref:hypothetical protein n=1 Tax=Flavobacterium sp. UMI-01 TaxID=1441053 RepID=UPI001C7D6A0D|nr:hypothetical protein [Flavobacterium sp. UMI-01]GIZ10351.1 hypothetical protein FUMI01_30750 [Flavobacterium sp. UMI-01]
MKKLIVLVVLFVVVKLEAQELFVATEPASNMPTGSIGVRLSNAIYKRELNSGSNYFLMSELMWGVNKDLMVHTSFFTSNRTDAFQFEGASIYAKYRFFSIDDVHSHFRVAGFGRYSINNAEIAQEQIETMRHNSGYELGLVATQLLGKVAISSSVSFEKAFNNGNRHNFPVMQSDNATNYTLSFGKLMYPKKYTNFKETNINLMLEFVGQTLNGNGKSYLDAVPSLQFIINSQARIDLSYKRQLLSSMDRLSPNGFSLNVEYTFFNVTN